MNWGIGEEIYNQQQECKDMLESEFYIKMTKKYGWTKDVLINQIKYALNDTERPIGVSTYQILDSLPDKLKKNFHHQEKSRRD